MLRPRGQAAVRHSTTLRLNHPASTDTLHHHGPPTDYSSSNLPGIVETACPWGNRVACKRPPTRMATSQSLFLQLHVQPALQRSSGKYAHRMVRRHCRPLEHPSYPIHGDTTFHHGAADIRPLLWHGHPELVQVGVAELPVQAVVPNGISRDASCTPDDDGRRLPTHWPCCLGTQLFFLDPTGRVRPGPVGRLPAFAYDSATAGPSQVTTRPDRARPGAADREPHQRYGHQLERCRPRRDRSTALRRTYDWLCGSSDRGETALRDPGWARTYYVSYTIRQACTRTASTRILASPVSRSHGPFCLPAVPPASTSPSIDSARLRDSDQHPRRSDRRGDGVRV